MRRAVLTLASTAAGLAALLSFKTHSAASVDAAGAMPSGSATASSASPSASSSSPAAGAASGGAASGRQSPAAKHSSAATTQTRTVTGTVASTQYGPMQVQLTLTGTKITKATVVQQTNDGGESSQIDSFAIPRLESETITAQSASVDAVSGATYTSSGYIKSLQSALDQARA